ncbi:MAG: hypothetical protein JST00_40800 [Deltaproteobacteria bacterium]|nr:hypothetical protein [Deltaproteobacteria bacterium]
MSLRRISPRFVPPPAPTTPEEERIAALGASVQSLRPSRAPSEPPVPIPADRSPSMVLVLAEMALRQLALGQRDEARKTVGDAIVVLEEVTDERVIAQASILVGEALLALDLPHLAHPHLARSVEILPRYRERKLTTRARIGLGRTLVALDDPAGIDVLLSARLTADGDATMLAQIEGTLEYATKLFDTPRSVHTGYGRPVSFAPPKL